CAGARPPAWPSSFAAAPRRWRRRAPTPTEGPTRPCSRARRSSRAATSWSSTSAPTSRARRCPSRRSSASCRCGSASPTRRRTTTCRCPRRPGRPPPTVEADARRVLERCDDLAAISEEAGRLTRRFATPALGEAGELVSQWMREAGMTVRRDPVGNVVGRYAGSGERTLLLGSHLDSVVDAGRYDGPLGVLVALA